MNIYTICAYIPGGTSSPHPTLTAPRIGAEIPPGFWGKLGANKGERSEYLCVGGWCG